MQSKCFEEEDHPKYLICNEWVVSFDFAIVCPFRLTKVHRGPQFGLDAKL